MPNVATASAATHGVEEQQPLTDPPPRLHCPTGQPLDFSFQELSDIAGHRTHPPPATHQSLPPSSPSLHSSPASAPSVHPTDLPTHEVNDAPDNSPALIVSPLFPPFSHAPLHPVGCSPPPSPLCLPQRDPSGLRLAYNQLSTVNSLPSVLVPSSPLLLASPASPLHFLSLTSVHWLDLSHNLLPSVPTCLSSLPHLSTLYLHSNRLTSLTSLSLLLPLFHLTRLTLHGNPVTQPAKGRGKAGEVRLRVLGVLARKEGRRVKELDFVGVTEREVAAGVRLVEGGERKRVKRRVTKAKVGGEEEEEEG